VERERVERRGVFVVVVVVVVAAAAVVVFPVCVCLCMYVLCGKRGFQNSSLLIYRPKLPLFFVENLSMFRSDVHYCTVAPSSLINNHNINGLCLDKFVREGTESESSGIDAMTLSLNRKNSDSRTGTLTSTVK
jgi:hypothetical protein